MKLTQLLSEDDLDQMVKSFDDGDYHNTNARVIDLHYMTRGMIAGVIGPFRSPDDADDFTQHFEDAIQEGDEDGEPSGVDSDAIGSAHEVIDHAGKQWVVLIYHKEHSRRLGEYDEVHKVLGLFDHDEAEKEADNLKKAMSHFEDHLGHYMLRIDKLTSPEDALEFARTGNL